jgi:outer membrane protein OmpA-like peptidoglycan-associated protein
MAAESSSAALASSFTDLMTSLAVIFILLLVATTQHTVMASAARNKRTQHTRESILEELQKQLSETGVQVEKDPKDPLSLLIVVPEQLMQFKRDKSDLSQDGQNFLGKFIPRLADVVCRQSFRNELNSIVVEGHTDSTAKNPENGDIVNLKLSQGRSMAVVESSLTILNSEQSGSRASYSCFSNLLSASGRGRSEVIHKASGDEDFDKSRRVIFKIRVRSFEQREVPSGEAALDSLQPLGSHGLSDASNGNQPNTN